MSSAPQPLDRRERYLVIGAGFAGLGIAAAFKRAGIPFDVVEADDEVGGNWYHGVYETVHIISSRKTTQYDDLPMGAALPDFPSKDLMLAYLKRYAVEKGVRPHIELRTAVARLEPAPGDA